MTYKTTANIEKLEEIDTSTRYIKVIIYKKFQY